MKIIRGQELEFIAASHEDPNDPGVWKKVLVKRDDLINGRIQMINWARMEVGKSFARHYHEDMEEVFIILSGEVKIDVGGEVAELKGGDAVLIPVKTKHEMSNTGPDIVEYIALGVSATGKGATVNV